jgi:hypothetical protein
MKKLAHIAGHIKFIIVEWIDARVKHTTATTNTTRRPGSGLSQCNEGNELDSEGDTDPATGSAFHMQGFKKDIVKVSALRDQSICHVLEIPRYIIPNK